jgi:kojibiose phosphorylase
MNGTKSPIRITGDWTINETSFAPSQIVTTGSNFMTGNGYLGYRGTFPEWSKNEYVACVVTDTYDNADGKWKELCTVPNALYTRFFSEGNPISLYGGNAGSYSLSLDIRHGRTYGGYRWSSVDGKEYTLEFERFASYASLHLVAQRVTLTAHSGGQVEAESGIDGDVWSLNGDHFTECRPFEREGLLGVECRTTETGLPITVVQGSRVQGPAPQSEADEERNRSLLRRMVFELEPGDSVVFEQVMSLYSGNDVEKPTQSALEQARKALTAGYSAEAEKSDRIWERMWELYDVRVESDDHAQALLHYNFYHNIIATPAHTDHLPVGARGLSCQAYQGAAFWDQEIFNLPMYLYTNPEVARNLLVYRHKVIEGARRKAQRLGYYGAFYPWISGDTGDELCPDYFFIDVLTGRKIRNHFNDWQIHISPDIAYTVWHYYLATGDWAFIRDHGAEILLEVGRFLISHAYYKKDLDRYEIVRVLGPDEYHENVDNNAFTNVQARYALHAALHAYERLAQEDPEALRRLSERIGLSEAQIDLMREMHEKIYIPTPEEHGGIIEQFRGYLELEDISPARLAERLQDPGEYWGWPNGVAVSTQVIKQADVVQLFCLHPDLYDRETIRRNYEYYEPRTQHRSSLSPAVHSIVASRIKHEQQAYEYFHSSCTIDLYNTNPPSSGGTFIGGIHTAACGIAWQMVVFGFAGFRTFEEGIAFEPHLPQQWRRIAFPLVYRGNRLQVDLHRGGLSLFSETGNREEITVWFRDAAHRLKPGETLEWET